ncbi:nucleotidyl transferase AbiEii/AbiGii toxin family protein [Arcobacter sp. FWKO B]|uniref:nucleotidyl transferase AbiEii/AbiGii toxin family protein n=1 Tax=Arcobacter sp. FWKO B TaxID=2593672 RepID=UPI001D187A7E|nr:nucleotidyl transferase AbiEii/AbiGii toxin family protein [Arcobacter sp. FWKO B]
MDFWWGGTALSMFHFQHRKSFDIDIFITESQLFDFLNPKWYIDETLLFDNSNYRFDGINHHIQLKTKDEIKVDFILNESIIHPPIKNTTLNLTYDLHYESIEDIIAKKIKWRKEDNLTRDIFDLAVAIILDNTILQKLIYTRFISFDDLEKLTLSLDKLDKSNYDLEISKIEPQTKEFTIIAKNAKEIMQKSVREIIIQQNLV